MITTADRGAVRHIVFDRADKRNAVTAEFAIELGKALDDAAGRDSVQVIVLRGAGAAFSAGIDVDELRAFEDAQVFATRREDFLTAWNRCEQIPKPTIAQIHGAAIGVGFELALACDLRISTEDAVMGLPETRFGAVPDVGGCSRLAALVGLGRAKELILTSALIDGRAAERIGLVNHAVPADRLDDAVTELCDKLLACAPAAVGQAKLILDAAAKPALEATLGKEVSAQVRLIEQSGLRAGDLAERLGKASG